MAFSKKSRIGRLGRSLGGWPQLYRPREENAEDSAGVSPYEKERADLLAGYTGNAARRDETYAWETEELSADVSRKLREAYVAAKNSYRQRPQVMIAAVLSGGVSDLAARRARSGYRLLRNELFAERARRFAVIREEYLHGGRRDREAYQLRLNALNRRYHMALEDLKQAGLSGNS